MIFPQRPDASPPDVIGVCAGCGTQVSRGERFCTTCGSPLPEVEDAELLEDLRQVTLGDYDIVGILGRGGMGLVYLGHEIALDRKVAIKVLSPSLITKKDVVERFRREAQIAASLRHRHITAIFGLKETPRLLFFVMEYIEGRTLQSVLRDEGRLSIDAAEVILVDVASALAYAHKRDVTHRDIKPGNIMIDTEGMAVITDFGVAKIRDAETLTRTGHTVGTPRYMSPEQWSGEATSLSDQFSLGAVMYEALAGAPPFKGKTIEELAKEQLFGRPPALSEVRPDCPDELAAAVTRMLHRHPKWRWPNLETALNVLEVAPAPPDHPVRQRLASLARTGDNVSLLPETPHSPIRVRREALGGTTVVDLRTRIVERLRALLPTFSRLLSGRPLRWATALVLLAGLGLGGVHFLGPGLDFVADEPPADRSAATRADGTDRPAENLGEREPAGSTPDGAADREEPDDLAADPGGDRPSRTNERGMPGTGEMGGAAAAGRGTPAAAGPTPKAVLKTLVTPVWAEVYIDGEMRGSRARGVDTVTAGVAHRLRFERAGFVTVDTVVTLQAGEERLVRINMRVRE